VEVLGQERTDRFLTEVAAPARQAFAGRRIVNINSTAAGGGVAELLYVLLPYARGVGIDARWFVIEADADFFTITKRLHNHLYGGEGDGGRLAAGERLHYEQVLDRNVAGLTSAVRPGDVVILHDPQTAGLAKHAKALGAIVVWRCHVGIDTPNEHSDEGWSFLQPYVGSDAIDLAVFTRREFAPSWLDAAKLAVIPPSIDPFSPKNAALSTDEVHAVLTTSGLLAGRPPAQPPTFVRRDGTKGHLRRGCDIVATGSRPDPDEPLVVQVSRWDRLKDMPGVMRGFADLSDGDHRAHLVLAGPVVTAVADDPEGAAVLQECTQLWRALPHAVRRKVTLACVPMADLDENATIVNALQRHAAVVTQKSLAEGFGLTIAEAMYKSRPVIGSAVGGIKDQIVDGETGVLVQDPTDLAEFTAALHGLLAHPERAEALGKAAHARACDEFLTDSHLARYYTVLGPLLER
jgi:trehalose synthase